MTWKPLCRHCHSNITNWNKILCDDCSKKAMQVLPSDPRERVEIYKILIEESVNPITRIAAEQLLQEDIEEVRERYLDPTDSYSYTRED